jgi:hypothetical protein
MIAERLASQMLVRPSARGPVSVAERLLAIQAQDLRGARLALRARTRNLSVSDIDGAMTTDRSLLITWLNRGTLHLVRSEDYWWLHALTTPQLFTANARRLAQEGVTPRAAERGVGVMTRALARDGPQTRLQLRELLVRAGISVEGQALVHILMFASLRGVIVRGPMVGKDHAFVLVRDWLGRPPSIDPGSAMAELARRYVSGHGPAGDRDLAKWAGLSLGQARAGLEAAGSALRRRPDGLFELARRRGTEDLPSPRLLGPWEPILIGWSSRRWLLDSEDKLIAVNGLFRPFALVRGRAVATWRMSRGEPTIVPFQPLSRRDRAALDADASDVVRFLGGERPG